MYGGGVSGSFISIIIETRKMGDTFRQVRIETELESVDAMENSTRPYFVSSAAVPCSPRVSGVPVKDSPVTPHRVPFPYPRLRRKN